MNETGAFRAKHAPGPDPGLGAGSPGNQVYANCVGFSAGGKPAKRETGAPFRFNRNGKGSGAMSDDLEDRQRQYHLREEADEESQRAEYRQAQRVDDQMD